MGRQIQIMSTDSDNDLIRDYLKANFNCLFFQSFSPTKEGLYIDSFNDTFMPDYGIKILFLDFEWQPITSQTETKEKLYYVSNTSAAPIIEFSKTNWETEQNGRLYWSKFFSGNPEYDVNAFEAIYDQIIKWVKRNAGGSTKLSGTNIYHLPEAWLRSQRKGQ